jgi:hypothetical protein
MKKFYIIVFVLLANYCAFAQGVNNARSTDNDVSTTRLTTKILKAYPNPATTYIVFEFQRNYLNGLSLEIYNLPGKKVAAAANILSSTTIQLQNFYRGVYIYKLLDRNGKVLESGKFQVAK